MRHLRVNQVLIIIVLLFACIIVQLVRIQLVGVIAGRALHKEAVKQRTPGIPIEVLRGEILDRYHRSLTGSGTRWSLIAFPNLTRQWPDLPELIAEQLGVAPQSLVHELTQGGPPRRLSVPIDETVAQLVAESAWPGIVAVQESTRYGPNSLARHVIGYIRPHAYSHPGDNVGEMGLEARYDVWLQRDSPAQLVACVDANYQLIDGLGYRLRHFTHGNGYSLHLTLDLELQRIIEEELDQAEIKRGAAVLMNPYSGEVLAMASRPNFDQNHPEQAFLLENALINAAVSPYQPGSIFKLVVAAAALEEGLVEMSDRFLCQGSIIVGGRTFSCSNTHGELSFEEAFAHSCNVVFIELAQRLGSTTLIEYAYAFGLSQITGLEVNGEASGSLPIAWGMGEQALANFALGQAETTVTPLQTAVLVATLANDGIKPTPYLVGGVRNEATGQTVVERRPSPGLRVVSATTARKLRLLMFQTTNYGTGQAAQILQRAAGKTGSAQTLPGQLSHAWFAGFAPFYVPEYVLVVFAESAGAGGKVAAPLFATMMNRILS